MLQIKNILVATDFSSHADAAFDYGIELASTFGATVHLLHVVTDVPATIPSEYYPLILSEAQSEIEDASWNRLDLLLARATIRGVHGNAVVRAALNPAAGIVDYARESHADMIVTGTRGRGRVSRLLMGSVAERVLRTASCPVLTVHVPDHRYAGDVVFAEMATATAAPAM